MTTKRHASLPIAVLLLFAAPAPACLWDYDTLRDERRGLPGIAEILAGRFEQHSRFFYEHRVTQMTDLLARDPNNLDAYDNLAVAYEKLGNHDKAIEVMLAKDKVAPNQYTTEANLGTFYFHKGDIAAGVPHIERALEINPNAHFGREEYQLKAAKYLADPAARAASPTADFLGIDLFYPPTDGGQPEPNPGPLWRGNDELLRQHDPKGKAIEGIVGMIRFGTGKSPDLFYALGNILALRGDKNLAYRAYRRAIDLGHPRADDIRRLMTEMGEMIESHGDFKAEIAAERADAARWVADYQEFEDALVRAGKDTTDESNYAPFYARHGRSAQPLGFALGDHLPRRSENRLALLFLGCSLPVIALYAALKRRRRKVQPLAPVHAEAADQSGHSPG